MATRKHIRGSSLLLAGRLLSVSLNFVTQVLIVRYLSKSDYGAWAYSLAIVAFFSPFATLGLKRSVTRFIPIYHENEEYDKLIGTILLLFGTIFITSLIILGSLHAAPEFITRLINDENYSVHLLLILIFLVPVEAIDGTVIRLFASFGNARAIFFRRHVVGPLLKLTVVILLITFEGRVSFLAYGYLAANTIGILIYGGVLLRLFSKIGLISHFNIRTINAPVKELFTFTIPLLTSDLVTIVMHSSNIMILGYFHNSESIASYQVILPLAHLNTIVLSSFGLLFTPLAARLFAKNDYTAINDLYWRSAIWLGVLSFPIFAVTFTMAKPLTLLLYGQRYMDSWIYLQILVVGYYFHALLGFNGLTLKVLGKLRYIVTINLLAVVINIALNFLLIPPYGTLGACIATGASMIIHNILKQVGLRLATGVNVFETRYIPLYAVIIVTAFILFMIQLFTTNFFILFLASVMASFFALKMCKHYLKIEQTFPELLNNPLLNLILGTNK